MTQISITEIGLGYKSLKNTFLVAIFTNKKEALKFIKKNWKTYSNKEKNLKIMKTKVYYYKKRKDIKVFMVRARYNR